MSTHEKIDVRPRDDLRTFFSSATEEEAGAKMVDLLIGRQVFADNGINREVLDLRVKCPNKDCNWTGELRAVEESTRIVEHT